MIWAFSGFDMPGVTPCDPRFATGVETLGSVGDGVGPATVRPALANIRDRMQIGLWWGRSDEVPLSDVWADGSRHPFNPDVPSDVERQLREVDLAINIWRVQVISLDQYALPNRNPAKGVRWLRFLQKRYPHVLFVTEAGSPDFLNVIAPTFATEPPVLPQLAPAWVCAYINPGYEYFLQYIGFGPQASNASRIADLGHTPIGGWGQRLAKETIAKMRWLELGERAIPGFRQHASCGPLMG